MDTEIPSPASGYVAELLVQEGETVPVDTLVCILSEEKPEPGSAASVSAAGAGDELSQADAGTEKETAGAGDKSGDKSWLSPAVRRLVRDNGVDPSAVQGTGEGGRLTRKDVMRHIENRKGTSTPSTEEGGREQAGGDRIEPMSVMRRKIAEHMVHSKSTSPHVSTVHEVDFTDVDAFRKEALIKGMDEVGSTLTKIDKIADFETAHPARW